MKQKRKRWDAIIERMPTDRPIQGAEIGVFRGELSAALLEALPNLTLYMVDRWHAYSEDEREADAQTQMRSKDQEFFDHAYRMAEDVAGRYTGRAIIVCADSVEASTMVPGGLDFVFIDALHSYEGCLADIMAWKDKVRPGGWIMGHDYPQRPGVKQAVDEMFDTVETPGKRIWAVQA